MISTRRACGGTLESVDDAGMGAARRHRTVSVVEGRADESACSASARLAGGVSDPGSLGWLSSGFGASWARYCVVKALKFQELAHSQVLNNQFLSKVERGGAHIGTAIQ